MSDQPLPLGYLEQFFRSFARPDLDRIVEERLAESRERSERWWVRWVTGSAEFLEGMYRSLDDDVRYVEQRLDEVHVRIARNDPTGVPSMIENARYRHERSVAARGRVEKYLADLEKEIDRIPDVATQDAFRVQSRDLQRRMDELSAPLEVVGRRLDRYSL